MYGSMYVWINVCMDQCMYGTVCSVMCCSYTSVYFTFCQVNLPLMLCVKIACL